MTAPAHPSQPLVTDDHGVVRFHANAIVRHLLDHGGIDLNRLALLRFTDADRAQFAQLIGYSLSGFGELDYVTDSVYEAAQTGGAAAILAKLVQETRGWNLDGLHAPFREAIEAARNLS